MNFRQHCLKTIATAAKDDARCLIIGEVAQSHDGSLGAAHAFVDAIANAGADAVKFQTHIAAAESTAGEPWRVKFSKQDRTRYEYWRRMEFTAEQWADLKQHADERGLLFMSTPFSDQAVELLDKIGMKVWKMASGEIGNSPMLRRIAASRNPIILSSGMSDWDELDCAVKIVKENGNELAVLQCTTAYPCPPEQTGLNVMQILRERYDCAIGLSDHSGKIFAGLAAATLGAEVLEVHVAFSREMFGPDVPASVTTTELKQLVAGVRDIERMIANPIDKTEAAEKMILLRRLFTKSIVAASDLAAGTVLTRAHLEFKKPGTGLPPAELPALLGRTLQCSLKADEMLLPQHLAN